MAQAGNVDQKRGNPKVFFGIAYFMAVLLALLSSLDAAFVYIFLGLAVFFTYLGLRALPRNILTPEAEVYGEKNTSRGSVFEDLKRRFAGKSQSPTFQAQRKKIISLGIFFGTIFLFFVIIVAIFSGSDSDDVDSASAWQQQAMDFYTEGKYDSAYIYYHRLTTIPGFTYEGDYGLGNIMALNRQYDSAIYYYNRALAEDPDLINVRYGKALVLKDMERFDESLMEVRTILSADESYTDAYLVGGDAYYVQKKYDSALYYYEPAYNLGARSAILLHIMAYLYDNNGRKEEAIQFYKEALSYDDTLVEVYQRLGELLPGEEGEEYRRKAIELKN